MDRTALLLHANAFQAAEIAAAASNGAGLSVVAAGSVKDAIVRLARERYDLLVVDAELAKPPAVEFLEKAREKTPRVLRAVLYSGARALSPADLVNRAGVCALLRTPLEANRLLALIEEYARPVVPPPASVAPAAPTAPAEEVADLKAQVAELEKKLAKAEKDLRIARAADDILKDEQLKVAELKAKQAGSKLGADIDIDYRAADLEEEFSNALEAMLESPHVNLPVLPQVGLELQKMMKDPDVSFEKVAEIVSMEASLSARILSICNSPMYAGVDPISNIQQAVARLGREAMRDVVQTAASEDLFKTRFKAMEDLLSKLWTHSLATGHCNTLVGQSLGIEEADDLFVLGLLHDIGKILIASLIQQGFDAGLWNTKMITPKVAMDLIQRRHADLGERLMRKWGYPELFVETVRYHNEDATIQTRSEAVVVTYYSNLLTRKLGYSLVKYDHEADPLNGHDIAQALNMSPGLGAEIGRSAEELIARIKTSYNL